MDGTTRQNAALVEELAAAARMMDVQAEQARHNIKVFRLSEQDVAHAETDVVRMRKTQRALSAHSALALEHAG